jgi:hypothetical protein
LAESLQLDSLRASAMMGLANPWIFPEFRSHLLNNPRILTDLKKLSSATLAEVMYSTHVRTPLRGHLMPAFKKPLKRTGRH